jgi:predicted dehydrogenase
LAAARLARHISPRPFARLFFVVMHQFVHRQTRPAPPWTRRQFLSTAAATAAFTSLAPLTGPSAATPPDRKYRAVIIGHTGRGDYGHNLDLIFAHRRDVEVVAVADPVAEGRSRAAARSGARRQYADYREMLRIEKPHLASVAPRWTDQHHAMALAALQAGAHVFMEKPFTRTLAEADELLSLADQKGLRIAVAHQMRLSPEIVSLREQLAAGAIGDLLEMRAHGKQDRRAGGEDLMVLGVHLFDLMRCFAGEPEWCTARVLDRGRPITRQSGRPATEDIGPVAGDEVFAQFAFASGINATFTSRGPLRQTSGPWGMELIGSRGAARILADLFPRVYVRRDGDWTAAGRTSRWEPWERPAPLQAPGSTRDVLRPNQRLVDDWLAALAAGREPVCSGRAGARALEMALAVFEAGVRGERVPFPMTHRNHPLAA